MRFPSKALAAAPALTLTLLLAGCAGGASVILVPDQQGKVGKAEVSTEGGKQLLTQAGAMTRTSGPRQAPGAITTADPAYLASTFGEALAVEPPAGETFTLYFKTGSSMLAADDQKIIDDIAAAVKRRAAISVRISGHTDSTGSAALDTALSLERVKQVQALLLDKGVPPERISTSYHGKGNPAVPTPDGVAEPRNRRVVVIVH
ncbi:OmpA family protein [Duganella sp. LX20W]|uniref:OmpA family protein n=1 Tax=Rugamonas brunnea TaxID=2758569 RepID=A0A7W2ET05_9BURK|nr:OmpA family protein [Rugamonas brunnea]MBA5638080.1 OmpA family protein [Rugamonas brunnea]